MSRMTLVDFPKPTEPDRGRPEVPAPLSPSRVHRLRARGGGPLLLVLSVALCLLGAEALVRLTGLGAARASGYAPVNTELAANRHENSRGYRDDERTLAKPAGVRRVVSVGDSFAWGAGVKFDDAYPHRLERDLASRRHESWEVVNLALRGMNTVDEAAKLAGEGMAYDPDVVLVGYVLNDSEDEGSAEKRRADDWLERRRQGPAARGLLGRSALFRMVTTRLEATAENRRRSEGYRSMYADDDPGWTAGRKALRSMGALCRQKGIPLLVAVFPLFGNPLDDRYPFADIHAKVSQAAREAGAHVVDLLPVYRGLRWDLLVIDGFDDEHPNEVAHRIAAGVLVRSFDDVVAHAKPPPTPAKPATRTPAARPARPKR